MDERISRVQDVKRFGVNHDYIFRKRREDRKRVKEEKSKTKKGEKDVR